MCTILKIRATTDFCVMADGKIRSRSLHNRQCINHHTCKTDGKYATDREPQDTLPVSWWQRFKNPCRNHSAERQINQRDAQTANTRDLARRFKQTPRGHDKLTPVVQRATHSSDNHGRAGSLAQNPLIVDTAPRGLGFTTNLVESLRNMRLPEAVYSTCQRRL